MIEPGAESSLFIGGPLHRLYARSRLLRPPLDLVGRRIAVITAVTWLPLLLLSLAEPSAGVGFLRDFEAQLRFLVAMPLLVYAEVVVDRWARKVVEQIGQRELVPASDRPRYEAALASARRQANSAWLEIVLVALVYTVGHYHWREQVALGQPTWYAAPDASGTHYTATGCWYAFVGVPAFQFLLLRWYVRLFTWFQFLWRVSRLALRLDATHPDLAGGIGFIGQSAYAFAPLLFAQGAMLSGLIANRIFHEGATLMSFKVEAAVLVAAVLLLFLGPFTVFTPLMMRTKKKGLLEYGCLSTVYVREFHRKWVNGGAAPDEVLVGNADIQSLADMINSFQPVKGMRVVPYNLQEIAHLALITVAPIAPLALTVVPLEKLISLLLKVFI